MYLIPGDLDNPYAHIRTPELLMEPQPKPWHSRILPLLGVSLLLAVAVGGLVYLRQAAVPAAETPLRNQVQAAALGQTGESAPAILPPLPDVQHDMMRHAEHVQALLDRAARQIEASEEQLNGLRSVYTEPAVEPAIQNLQRASRNIESARAEVRLFRALAGAR